LRGGSAAAVTAVKSSVTAKTSSNAESVFNQILQIEILHEISTVQTGSKGGLYAWCDCHKQLDIDRRDL
jgi:hypothetical protein